MGCAEEVHTRRATQTELFHDTVAMMHGQIASLSDWRDVRDAAKTFEMAPAMPPPPVVSHK